MGKYKHEHVQSAAYSTYKKQFVFRTINNIQKIAFRNEIITAITISSNKQVGEMYL